MALILERPQRSQLQGLPKIDWSNPLTRGLFFVCDPAIAEYDLVSRARLTRSGSPTISNFSDQFGRAARGGNFGVSSPGYLWLRIPNIGPAITIATLYGAASGATTLVPLAVTSDASNNQRIAFQNDAANRSGYYRVGDGGSSISANGSFDTSYAGAYPPRLVGLVLVQDGVSSGRFYENGALTSSDTTNVGSQTFNTISIGANKRASPYGANNVRAALGVVWNRALSPAEVAAYSANPWQIFQPRRIYIPTSTAASGVTGTVAVTTGADTSSASGTTTVVGSLASTTAADTSVASGTVTIVGTLAVTTGADTSVAIGTTTVIGTLARTTGADTSVASGNVGSGASGSLAVTTGTDTSAASGTTTVVGTLARTTASDTVSASGVSGSVTGTLAVTSGSDTGYAYDVLPATVRKLENWYYRPALVPFSAEAWLVRELNTISRSTYGAAPFVQMVDVTVEPDKPNPGMVVFTTATAWDPGSGAGVYCYRSGAWHLLG